MTLIVDVQRQIVPRGLMVQQYHLWERLPRGLYDQRSDLKGQGE